MLKLVVLSILALGCYSQSFQLPTFGYSSSGGSGFVSGNRNLVSGQKQTVGNLDNYGYGLGGLSYPSFLPIYRFPGHSMGHIYQPIATVLTQRHTEPHQEVVQAAVQQLGRTIEYKNVPYQEQPIQAQVIEVESSEVPLHIHFKTKSSSVSLSQSHQQRESQEAQLAQTQDEPARLIHEIQKPIIQEVREVITPYRQVTQEIQPVVEAVHTVVTKAEGQRQQYVPNVQPTFSKVAEHQQVSVQPLPVQSVVAQPPSVQSGVVQPISNNIVSQPTQLYDHQQRVVTQQPVITYGYQQNLVPQPVRSSFETASVTGYESSNLIAQPISSSSLITSAHPSDASSFSSSIRSLESRPY